MRRSNERGALSAWRGVAVTVCAVSQVRPLDRGQRCDSASVSACASATPAYFSLKALAVYSGLSVRTLRNHLHDHAHPLPHYHIGGKILVKRDDFDEWAKRFRRVAPSINLDMIVDDIINCVR